MREQLSFDRDWIFHMETREDRELKPSNKGLMGISAKTQRKKYGPAAYDHNDTPNSWSFEKEMTVERWTPVNLPHDYLIEQTPVKENNPAWGFMEPEPAWYRKHFMLPASDRGRRITVLFEGVSGSCEVYLNGCLMKYNHCGYTPFECDITDYVFFDQENVLAVRVDPSPIETWSYPGAGIYRHVWLRKTDRIAADLYGVFVYPLKEDGCWRIPVMTTVRNDSFEDADICVKHTVLDENGSEAVSFSCGAHVPLRDKTDAACEAFMKEPELWDPERPYLYTLVTEIYIGNELRDRAENRFGFRTFRLDPDEGLFVNGRPVKIRGVCAHQDFGLTGKAVPDNVSRYQIELMKKMGANGFRCSHYPHNPALMDALDELGFIVMAENRHFDSDSETLEQVELWIKRDRNRPSVFFWSTGNEELQYHTLEQGANIQRALRAHVRRFDPYRPVSSAAGFPEKCIIYNDVDMMFLNYRFKKIDELHAAYPHLPALSSENVAVGMSFGAYFGARPDDGRESAYDHDRDKNTLYLGREGTWKLIMERPWLAGGYQWDAIEHRGEAEWPRVCSVAGAIDLFLRPKESFYQNQSHWTDEPMMYVFPHWNPLVPEGETVNVWAYTNCNEAELFLNGESFGRKAIEKYGHAEWEVPYMPGKLEVQGYTDGVPTASCIRETTGAPHALKLRYLNGPAVSGRGDVALFECFCVDEEGREVPDAHPLVHFDCDTPSRIVGTGSDNTDHVPVTCHDRRMYMNHILVGVRIGNSAETLTLFAHTLENDGVLPAKMTVPVEKAANEMTGIAGIIRGGELGGHTAFD